MEAEAEANALVFEIAPQIGIERAPGAQQRQQLEHVKLGQISPALEGRLQKRRKALKLVAVLVKEAAKAAGVLRAELGDCALHTLQVRCSQQLATGAEDQPVLGIQSIHGNLFIETSTCCRKDLAQYFWVEEESRPGIEFETASLHGGGTAADDVAPLHDGDIDSRPRQQHSSGQTAWTGPDDNDFLEWFDHLVCRDNSRLRGMKTCSTCIRNY